MGGQPPADTGSVTGQARIPTALHLPPGTIKEHTSTMNRRWICQACREVNHLQAPTCFHCSAPRAAQAPNAHAGEFRQLRSVRTMESSLSLPVVLAAAWSAVVALVVSRLAV